MFKIAWLYDDILNLYGDSGNILVLERLLTTNNIDYQIDRIRLNDPRDISDYELVFIGGGSDSAQSLVYEDFLARRIQLQNVLANQGFILAICGGYQLCGEYYLDQHDHKLLGLGLFDYYTKSSNQRLNGNLVVKVLLNNQEHYLVGYENHAGQTYQVDNPLATVVSGKGNNVEDNQEGCFQNNFIGTYIHGPLLPKNPEIAKYIIEYVLTHKFNINKNININLKYANLAKEAMLKRLI